MDVWYISTPSPARGATFPLPPPLARHKQKRGEHRHPAAAQPRPAVLDRSAIPRTSASTLIAPDNPRKCPPVVEFASLPVSLCNITEKPGFTGVIGSANATKYEFCRVCAYFAASSARGSPLAKLISIRLGPFCFAFGSLYDPPSPWFFSRCILASGTWCALHLPELRISPVIS